ncbi:DUF4232 domain-containing protein [Streptomyces althioticus]|uniref:DUF4232 domain-containing protein n=1 Tax=Streptomyces althioticus TaxID=83380 RepID=UPI0037B145A2
MPDHARRSVPESLRSTHPLVAKRRRAARTVVGLAVVALLATTAAGCGDGGDGDSPDSGTAAPSSTTEGPSFSSSPATPTGTGTSSGSTPATTAPPSGGASAPDRCTADALTLRLGPADAGAGNIRFDLQIVNGGEATCELQGFPGVSLLRGDGSTIGVPATREGGQGAAVKLAPGESAHATLRTVNKGVKGSDCWPAPSLIKVFPPERKDALTLRSSTPVVCGDVFTVTALRAQ